MANPQPDEFTRISNELYTAIMQTDFSKRQRNILDLVIRMSYGCGRKRANLRPVDFELVGVYKTHVRKELDYLVSVRVLVIDGDDISLNKNYEEWRVSVVRGANSDRYKALIKRNLGSQNNNDQVTKTVTEVTKTVPAEKDEVTKTVINGYQNSNHEVTKTVTDTDTQPNNGKGSETRKEKVKEIKDIVTPLSPQETIEDVFARFPRYTTEQWTTIRDYWDTIKFTRRSGKVAPSIVAKQMDYWERFSTDVVLEALRIHTRKYQNRREDYTAGIMRLLVNENKGGQMYATNSNCNKNSPIDRSKFLWQG